MNTIHITQKPKHYGHKHWQSLKVNIQAKVCQRVCLSHNEKKKLKISFPSKNFKNANSQPDSKIFGQVGCKTQ